ncbi:MAG: hypothetical protein ACN4GF_04800 [Lentimonas sp.]
MRGPRELAKGQNQSKKCKKQKRLPPDWKKKLEVGGVLDPEFEEKAEPLPQKILDRLPKTPESTSIINIGDELIRIFENSREIIDILSGTGGEPQVENNF